MPASIKTLFIETCSINDALVVYRGNKTALAEELGVNRGTLRSYIDIGGEQLVKVIRDGSAISGFELINRGIKS